jgi:DNA (cytosine-5)-methyltransferase 1
LLITAPDNLPHVLDLFSGCGGLSLGFLQAGFTLAGGVDFYQPAVNTLNANLHTKFGEASIHQHKDVTTINSIEDIIHPDHKSPAGYIVIGGPPCQAYSQAGKAKLKALGRQATDKRGDLWEKFIELAIHPEVKAVVMENVPEATTYKKDGVVVNVPHQACVRLEKAGFTARWSIVNAANYGVPQTRERVFVIAIREPKTELTFPPVTHTQPTGKTFSLKSNQRAFKKDDFFPHEDKVYFIPPQENKDLPPWVSVKEALSDLPSILPTSTHPFPVLPTTQYLPYLLDSQNPYQSLMRKPLVQTKASLTQVSGNSIRNTKRDFRIFEKMKQGDNYGVVYPIATALYKQELKNQNLSEPSPQAEILKKEFIPPYDTTKFLNKWKKFREDYPSWTIVAHLSEDTYSHLHYKEPRGISVREAARLQSFPDDFEFSCGMSDAFKQIGNAVPPRVSFNLASQIKKLL